ncbi:hypothetical protein D3C73_1266330 [compost metagenome]
MRDSEQADAEEARVVFDIFDNHFGVTQRVRGLQFVARVSHFGHQATHPGVQLKFQQATVFGGTNVFTLNKLQVVRDTRQQEDIRQT